MRFLSFFLAVFLLTLSLVYARPLTSYGHRGEWQRLERAEASRPVRLTFAVKQQNISGLTERIMAASNPASAEFGNYLSPAEIRSLVALPQSTQAVIEWLGQIGAQHIEQHPTGDLLAAELPVSAIESVFSTHVHEYRAVHGRPRTIVRAGDIEIPEAIAEHLELVFNINHFPPSRPLRVLTTKPADSQGNVDPATMNTVYGVDSNTVSHGASSGVFESDAQSYDGDDLAAYQKQFNLPVDQSMVKVVGPNDPSSCASNPNNCGESMLDVEILNAMAQGATILFNGIDANDQTPFIDWLTGLVAMPSPPQVNSVSYGEDETQLAAGVATRFDSEIQKAVARGITVVVSSGDDGAAGSGARNNVPAGCGFFPSYPASSPWVTAVGATQGPEAGTAEILCASNTGGLITSGGGFSTVWPKPSYQSSVVSAYLASGDSNLPPASQFANTGRGYPDVALLGHNYYVITGGQTSIESGTSASAPLFAGMLTLVNDARIAAGKKPLGFVNPHLYSFYGSNNDQGIFNDITSGINNCPVLEGASNQDCCQYGFPAIAGWDASSGLGSVQFAKLKAAFLALP